YDEIAHRVRVAQDGITERMVGGSRDGQILRAARRFALVAAAGELAIQLGVLPWRPGSAEAAAEELFSTWRGHRGDDPSEVREAIEQIGTLIDRYGVSRFDPPNRTPDTRPVPDRLGWMRGDGEARQWLIPPGTWKGEFCKGFDHRSVARALA